MRPFTIFETPWEKRVFIGGSIGLSPTIEKIRDIVNEAGYDAVIATDFETPEDIEIYHKCLVLLHCCKYAIFDFSELAGQSLEMERTPEYGVTTLAIWPMNKDRAISEMIKSSIPAKKDIEQQTYGTFSEMEFVISEFSSKEETSKRLSHARKEVTTLATDKEEAFLTDKETIQITASVYYFDTHDGGHYFPVGDSPGLSADELEKKGGGDINFNLLVSSYLTSEPESSYSAGGSYTWHINSIGTVDTIYKGVYP